MDKRLARALAAVGIIAVLAFVAVLTITQTDWGRERVRRQIEKMLQAQAHGIVKIGRVSGNLMRGATLHDVVITDSAGAPFLNVREVHARFGLWTLRSRRVELDDLRFVRPIIVLDRRPGGKWNYDRIFPRDTLTPEGERKQGWGTWIRFTDTRIDDGDLTVRTPWTPDPVLTGAEREDAIREAIGEGGRLVIAEVPGGYQKISRFSNIFASLPLVRLADPNYKTRMFQVADLRMSAAPFKPPKATVRSLVGTFEADGDSVWWANVRVVQPGTRMAGGGRYTFEGNDLRLRLRADPISTADVRWVYPRLPLDGGGRLDFAMDWIGDTSTYIARNADIRLESARLQGSIGVTVSDTFALHDTDLRFTSLDTRLIQRLFPQVEPPQHGMLAGRAALDGGQHALDVDGDVTFENRQSGRSRVMAVGGLRFEEGGPFRAQNLRVNLRPLQLALVRAWAPEVKLRGALSGGGIVNGTVESMDVDADVTLDDPRSGRSRVLADGRLGVMDGAFNANDLRLTMRPVQVELVREFAPDLKLFGVLTGNAVLNGSTAARMAVRGDVTHVDRGYQSRVTGSAAVRRRGRSFANSAMEVDANLRPLALATAGRFVPQLGLRGTASGPLRLSGTMRNFAIRTDLAFSDGGTLNVAGELDLASRVKGYDLDMRARLFNANAVIAKAPATSITATASGRGRGFDLATLNGTFVADVQQSTYDTVDVTAATVRMSAANGVANIDTLMLQIPEGVAHASGTFGLAPGRTGTLRYNVDVDSLHRLAGLLPAQEGEWPPRPAVISRRLEQARADSARRATALEVERAATGRAAVTLAPIDTPQAIPRNQLAGSLAAEGMATGNIRDFGLRGTATGENIVALGHSAQRFTANYDWANARTPQSRMTLDASGSELRIAGFELDSATTRVRYSKPSGSVELAVHQDNQRTYNANADFTLNAERNEARLNDLRLRFDTTLWASTRPSVVHWGSAGVDIDRLELRNRSNGRIFVDGLVPNEGRANLHLAVDNFAVQDIIALTQSDIDARGFVSLDMRASGTAESPTFRGAFGTQDFVYNGTAVPELHGTVSYANQTLTGRADAMLAGERPQLFAEGTVPVNLALKGVTGSRFPTDRQMDVAVRADSFPLQWIPQFNNVVTNLRGSTAANFRIRGTLRNPEINGTFLATNAQARVVPLGVDLKGIAASIRMLGDTVVIDSLVADSDGRIALTGGLGIGSLREPSFDLKLRANNARVLDNDKGDLKANIDMTIAGPFDNTYVQGGVRIRDGFVYIPESDDKDVIGTQDPALFSVLDTAVAGEKELFPAQSPLLANLRMDVSLQVDRNVFVRSRDANVEVYTDNDLTVRVNRRNNTLVLDGVLLSERGEYTFLTKRFEIKRGSATFVNLDHINPTIQVTGEYEVRLPAREAINIRILIGGTMLKPRIALESDAQPPIAQSDLLSYLAFGRSSTSLLQLEGSRVGGNNDLLGTGAALATKQLATVAVGVVADEWAGEAARSLGADVFNITPADVQTDVGNFLRGTELEFGKYIKWHTFVGVKVRPDPQALQRPGLFVQHRFGGLRGYRYEASFEPRYLLREPTLAPVEPATTSVFGLFLIREWRY